ncbi:MAG: chloride channel protein, partial [Pseudomonadota bacterium]
GLLTASPGAFALVGMAAMASAVLGAPISTPLMLFELTGDYEIAIHAMVGSVSASLTARPLMGGHGSFFDAQRARRDDG